MANGMGKISREWVILNWTQSGWSHSVSWSMLTWENNIIPLHIGHMFLTHFYLLKGEEPPVCIPCDQLCSIEHLLTGCVDLIEWRRQFFLRQNLWVCCSVSVLRTTSFSFQNVQICLSDYDDIIVHPSFYCDSHTFFFFFFFFTLPF